MIDICKNCKCCSTIWEDCDQCEDGYVEDDWGDGIVPAPYLRKCSLCEGKGGWERCINNDCSQKGHN